MLNLVVRKGAGRL